MIKCRTLKQTSNTEISGESKNTKRRESPESLQEKHYVTYYIQSRFFFLAIYHSQASLVSKLLKHIAKA